MSDVSIFSLTNPNIPSGKIWFHPSTSFHPSWDFPIFFPETTELANSGGFTGLRDGSGSRVADRSERSTDAVSGCRSNSKRSPRWRGCWEILPWKCPPWYVSPYLSPMEFLYHGMWGDTTRFPPLPHGGCITPTVSSVIFVTHRSSSMCPPVWRRQRDLAALNHPSKKLRCFDVTSWGLAINLIFLQHSDTGRDRNVRKMIQDVIKTTVSPWVNML